MVLILVLMEDALARLFDHTTKITQTKVLILVLMEDALAHMMCTHQTSTTSLNPCFNGRCTRTAKLG